MLQLQLTNYWMLLIWLFTGGLLLRWAFPKQQIKVGDKMKERWEILPAIILVVPYIIWAGFRQGTFGDTYSYMNIFRKVPSAISELPQYLESVNKDKGFSILMALIKAIFGNSEVVFFIIIVSIQFLCMIFVLRKYSSDFWVSIFVFVATTDYLSWMWNGIRQFTAVAIVFAASELMIKKKYGTLIAIILLASTIHASALIMIPIVFIIQGKAWNKKTVLCIIGSIITLKFIDQFTNILEVLLVDTQYTDVISNSLSWEDDGTNPLRILVYAVPTILSIAGYKWIKYEDDPMINLAVNAGIISTGIGIISTGFSGIYMGRLPIYVSMYANCILLPWELDHFFTKNSAATIKIIAMICYFAFFYYQMHFAWTML